MVVVDCDGSYFERMMLRMAVDERYEVRMLKGPVGGLFYTHEPGFT